MRACAKRIRIDTPQRADDIASNCSSRQLVLVSQTDCLCATMDSLANYASDGDNSNNSDDAKVSSREERAECVPDGPDALSFVTARDASE